MAQWLTAKFLNSSQRQELISGKSSDTPTIVEDRREETKTHVNTLLERERYVWVVLSDGSQRVLEEDEYAIEFFKRVITTQDGHEISLQASDKTVWSQDGIQVWDVFYPGATERRDTCVGIVSKDDVSDIKPDGAYHKDYKKEQTLYISDQKLKEENTFLGAKIRNISLMEVTSLKSLEFPDAQLGLIMKHFSWQNIEDPDFLEHADTLLSKAKKILEKRVFHLSNRTPYKKVQNLSIGSKQDVLDILEQTSSDDRRTNLIYCTLLKYMYLLETYGQNPLYSFLEKLELWSIDIQDVISKTFNLPKKTSIEKDKRWVYVFKKRFQEYDDATVQIWFRVKSLDSMISKSLWKAGYLRIEDFRDIFAMTVYIPEKSKKHTISIMQEFDANILNSQGYLKNKGFVTTEMVELHEKAPNQKPKDTKKYHKACWRNERWIGTSDMYDDAKFIWTHTVSPDISWVWDSSITIWTEVKFLHGSIEYDSNEVGTSFNPVYDYFAKHFEWEKNRNPFITARNISELLDNFFDVITIESQKYEQTIYQVLSEIYTELANGKSNRNFPTDLNQRELEKFYHAHIKQMLFYYLVDKYWLQRAKYKSDIVFTTAYNREQLGVGGRWYKYQ